MSSTDSSSTERPGPAPEPDPSRKTRDRGSALAAVVTLAILVLLVWGLGPRQSKLKPAPLLPASNTCTPTASDFAPSSLTKIPTMPLDALPPGARNRVLLRLNMEPCSCGCKQSLAMCRAGNPSCPMSPQAADAVVKQETAETARPNTPAPRDSPQ